MFPLAVGESGENALSLSFLIVEIHSFLGNSLSFCFPGGSGGKESACNVGDLGLILGLR